MSHRIKLRSRAVLHSVPAARLTQGCVVLFSLISFFYFLLSGNEVSGGALPETEAFELVIAQDKDYSRFTHSNQFHTRLPCLLCHRRDDNSARIRFPGKTDHLPCAGCHALQFSDRSSPICSICHTNAETGAMKRFPPLRSFGARFDHSRHLRVACSTCHKSENRGVVRSIPSGPTAHTTCFQCHSANASNAMASCSVCHQPGRLVRTSESSRAFRIGFSHDKHGAVSSRSCNACHSIRAGMPRGRQVSSPAVAMHFASQRTQSCAGCHNGDRAFGANEFANCRRCHQGNTFRF
jgi:c(7)-type cytochrome triheme protein